MPVRRVTVDDLNWVVEVLSARRAALARHVPLFWAPPPDAARVHRQHLEHVLAQPGAAGFRTEHSVLIAATNGISMTVDDASVPAERWTSDREAAALWDALGDARATCPVRLVCPVYEPERGWFASTVGLQLDETWWLMELPGSAGGAAGVRVDLPGASAVTVAAPPVYAPPGPTLVLSEVDDPAVAMASAVLAARQHGCAGIVVTQHDRDLAVETALREAGLRRHCEFYEGEL